MSANADSDPTTSKDNSLAIAIVLPCLFVVVLVLLLAISFLLPKISGRDNPAVKEERKKKRMAKLESNVKSQHFSDWAAVQKKEHPEDTIVINPLCVICLDEIDEVSQIRGLGCLHVFHQECLDDWFSRWNEFCPLCHRPIIPGTKEVQKKPQEPPPVAFIV